MRLRECILAAFAEKQANGTYLGHGSEVIKSLRTGNPCLNFVAIGAKETREKTSKM